ncbi:MAG: hypothetical protein LBH26_00340, partial [Treponema sp.]|nr:hypothetical protein [Treponema sp.]
AALEDIRLFKARAGPGLKIKAAGGIRTREDMAAFIEAGAGRIGTSSAAVLVSGGGPAICRDPPEQAPRIH